MVRKDGWDGGSGRGGARERGGTEKGGW